MCYACAVIVWRGGGLIYFMIKMASVFKLPYGGGGGEGGRRDNLLIKMASV